MTILIVYDSVFGNTATLAKAMASELETTHSVRLAAVGTATNVSLDGVDLLIVGSPTRGFRPTPNMQNFLDGYADATLGPLAAAAFDTRLDLETIHPAPLRWVVEVGGYASDVLQRMLAAKGCVPAGEPAGFLVGGTEGPLRDGEVERARAWARSLVKAG